MASRKYMRIEVNGFHHTFSILGLSRLTFEREVFDLHHQFIKNIEYKFSNQLTYDDFKCFHFDSQTAFEIAERCNNEQRIEMRYSLIGKSRRKKIKKEIMFMNVRLEK